MYSLKSLRKASNHKQNQTVIIIATSVYVFLFFIVLFRKPIAIQDFVLLFFITALFSMLILKLIPMKTAYKRYMLTKNA